MDESFNRNDNIDKNKKIILLAFKKTHQAYPGMITTKDAEGYARILNNWETVNGRKEFNTNINGASKECAGSNNELLTVYRSLGANFFNLRKKVENGEDIGEDEVETVPAVSQEDSELPSTFHSKENQDLGKKTFSELNKLFK